MFANKPLILALAAVSLLAGCKPGQIKPEIYSRAVSDLAMSSSFNGWTSIPAHVLTAADALLAQANYLGTRVSAGASPFGTQSFALKSAKAHVAHAAGADGSGQVISIVDAGFRTGHEAIAGQVIATSGTIVSDDHGTMVASVAASDGTNGSMIGMAPGAQLLLSYFGSNADTTAATQLAIDNGAIVQNNSWGLTDGMGKELSGSSGNYDAVFGSGSGATYVSKLKEFANSGVIVFAMSNDKSRSTYDLMASLPDHLAGIEKNFLAVINITPSTSGGQVTGGTLRSSACLEAARYCVGADGTVRAATAASNSSYGTGTGTSFAAPQVSGAIAVLADAFPGLNAQELRARLLASANNSWYKHTGYVKFSSTVKHGFNDTFGHGFIDLEAALLPIGGSYMPAKNGRSLNVEEPSLVSFGASGNALSRQLRQYQIRYADGLGGGFDGTADMLAAHAVFEGDPNRYLSEMFASGPGDSFALGSGFGSYLSGQEHQLAYAGNDLTLLLPSGSGQSNLGFELRTSASDGVRFGLSGIFEGQGMVGIGGNGDTSLSSLHGTASVDYLAPIGRKTELSLGARIGVAAPVGQSSDVIGFGAARYDEVALQLTARDLGVSGDRLALRLAMPQAVSGGDAQFVLPTSLSAGGAPRFQDIRIGLAPDARQVDLGVDFTTPVGPDRSLILSLGHSVNHGHVAGQSDTNAAIGWKLQF